MIVKFTSKKFLILLLFSALLVTYRNANAFPEPGDIINNHENLSKNSDLWNVHFQQTFVEQYKPEFHASYTGKNSMDTNSESALSLTTTLFVGVKLWNGGELYFNPEVSGGSGISKVQGIAGFTNNEVVRVGNPVPTFYPARLFFQQVVNLNDKKANLEDDANQIGTEVSSERLVFRFGKFSTTDYLDNNKFSHDGRSQFINWSLVSNGAWDYAADTRGYTMAFLSEYVNPFISFRLSAAMVSTTPNGAVYDKNILKNHSLTFEVEKPYSLLGKEGTARLLLFRNSEKSANYIKGLEMLARDELFENARQDGTVKYGFGINIEQVLANNIGLYLRAGWNDGQTESWMFTQIDRSLSLGSLIRGEYWLRESDELGLAVSFNGISIEHRDYLNSGGYGFIIGDGKLDYSTESHIETFYKFYVNKYLQLSLFYQFVNNPAYNKDRGPVNIYSLRTHIEF